MPIYLGNTLLTGSGGSGVPGSGSGPAGVPIGGFAFFLPPPDTAFTAGQEVYTDADNQVWLRSGAQLTSAGSGALEAAQYRDSQASVAVTESTS